MKSAEVRTVDDLKKLLTDQYERWPSKSENELMTTAAGVDAQVETAVDGGTVFALVITDEQLNAELVGFVLTRDGMQLAAR